MSRPVIAVDVDGTVADLYTEWLRRYNRDYNDNLHSEDITEWEMSDFVKPECGKKIYSYLHEPDLYDSVLPITGAVPGIARLRAGGLRVIFVSSCVPGSEVQKFKWLERHGLIESRADWYCCNDKSLIDAAMLVDDYEGNCRAFTDRNWKRRAVIFDQPHNRWLDAKHPIYRATSWRQVADFILERIDG